MNWKMQHVDYGCRSACVAMLASHRGIEWSDREVIAGSGLPWILKYDEGPDSFRAGMHFQNTNAFNRFLASRDLHLEGNSFTGTADELEPFLSRRQSLVVMLDRETLFGPDSTGVIHITPGHHVVLYERDETGVCYCLDPDGNLDRNTNPAFEEVRDSVVWKIPAGLLLRAMSAVQIDHPSFFLLEEGPGEYTEMDDVLMNSRHAIDQFLQKAVNLQDILGPHDRPDYFDRSIEVIHRYTWSLTHTLAAAVSALENPSDTQKALSRQLDEMQDAIVRHQRFLILRGNEKDDFFELFRGIAEDFTELFKKHLEHPDFMEKSI